MYKRIKIKELSKPAIAPSFVIFLLKIPSTIVGKSVPAKIVKDIVTVLIIE